MLLALVPLPASSSPIDECLTSLRLQTPVTSVHIQPESGYQPILDEINFAQCSIDLSMYILTSQEIVDALDHAVSRGIHVRVILEKQPFGQFGDQQEMFDRLMDIGVEVRWGPERFTYSHAKYLIVDDSVLVVTNQNFTQAGFNRNREAGAITTESRYVQEAQGIFEADWTGASFDGEIEHLVVSPINARSTIVGLIEGSTQSVWMYAEVLRDEDVTTALSNAAERGVDVRILVNESADEDDVPYFLDALSHGVQIRILDSPYVHSKVLIVDGEQALVGSQNYSYTSLNLNREIGIVISDADNLAKLVSVFARDWSRGEPVDSISISLPAVPSSLTRAAPVGRISFGRWGVV